MSIRSLKAYINSQLDGITVATIGVPLRAVSYPPPVDVLDAPIAYVWSLNIKEDRMAGTRGNGKKKGR